MEQVGSDRGETSTQRFHCTASAAACAAVQGNCPSNDCSGCPCGTTTAYQNIASWCSRFSGWNQAQVSQREPDGECVALAWLVQSAGLCGVCLLRLLTLTPSPSSCHCSVLPHVIRPTVPGEATHIETYGRTDERAAASCPSRLCLLPEAAVAHSISFSSLHVLDLFLPPSPHSHAPQSASCRMNPVVTLTRQIRTRAGRTISDCGRSTP